jgi:hypothetical protein
MLPPVTTAALVEAKDERTTQQQKKVHPREAIEREGKTSRVLDGGSDYTNSKIKPITSSIAISRVPCTTQGNKL